MRLAVLLTLSVSTSTWACGDAPEPPPPEVPAPAEGVFGLAPAATQGIPSVVSLLPSSDPATNEAGGTAVMDQLGLAFLPDQLVVTSGRPMVFTNSESLAHNVHVRFIENDSTVLLADMDPDDSRELTLDLEGGYDVTCDVHPGMRAVIYVTSAPFAAFADDEGAFELQDIPPGSYTASVWSVSPELRGERIVQISGPSTELDLTSFQ